MKKRVITTLFAAASLLTIGFASAQSVEPSESEMQQAVEGKMDEMLKTVNGKMTVQSFEKLKCESAEDNAYACRFIFSGEMNAPGNETQKVDAEEGGGLFKKEADGTWKVTPTR